MKQLEGQITFDDLMKEEELKKELIDYLFEFFEEKEKIWFWCYKALFPIYYKSFDCYATKKGYMWVNLYADKKRKTQITSMDKEALICINGFEEYMRERGIEL